MKKLFLGVLFLGAFNLNLALADGVCAQWMSYELNCHSLQTGWHTTQIRVLSSGCKGRMATVYRNGPADVMVPIANFPVQKNESVTPGASIRYRGNQFNLVVQTGARPLPTGGLISHLMAEVNGQRVVEDLQCTLE